MKETEIKIGIIGAGRFGLFIGKELSPFYDVIYFDKNIREGNKLCYSNLNECLKRDLVIIALPISSIEQFLIENKNKILSASILIDIASLKIKPAEWYKKYLPEGSRYILTHPLFGPDSAKASLEGHKIVISESRIDDKSKSLIENIFTQKLKLRIIRLSPEEHDLMMAYNLNLMHHLGRAFNDMGIQSLNLKMKSLQDIERITTFVMNDSEQLFKDFYNYNPFAAKIKSQFEQSFKKIADMAGTK